MDDLTLKQAELALAEDIHRLNFLHRLEWAVTPRGDLWLFCKCDGRGRNANAVAVHLLESVCRERGPIRARKG